MRLLNLRLVLLITFITICSGIQAQDDILKEIDITDTTRTVQSAFKSLKIVNFESTKLAAGKEFRFVVSHRFGSIKNGIDDFFGLDNAVTRLQFIYGISDKFNIGVSRSSFLKVYDLSLKYKIFSQELDGFPFEVAGHSVGAVNTGLKDIDPTTNFGDKLSFTQQILISRKVSEKLSLEVAPTWFYEATPNPAWQSEEQFIVGVGGRYKLGNRWSINMDYGIHTNRTSNSIYNNPLSIGVDLETGGHVFQMHFTNSAGMTERAFLGQTEGNWGDGDIYFGFNLTRVF